MPAYGLNSQGGTPQQQDQPLNRDLGARQQLNKQQQTKYAPQNRMNQGNKPYQPPQQQQPPTQASPGTAPSPVTADGKINEQNAPQPPPQPRQPEPTVNYAGGTPGSSITPTSGWSQQQVYDERNRRSAAEGQARTAQEQALQESMWQSRPMDGRMPELSQADWQARASNPDPRVQQEANQNLARMKKSELGAAYKSGQISPQDYETRIQGLQQALTAGWAQPEGDQTLTAHESFAGPTSYQYQPPAGGTRASTAEGMWSSEYQPWAPPSAALPPGGAPGAPAPPAGPSIVPAPGPPGTTPLTIAGTPAGQPPVIPGSGPASQGWSPNVQAVLGQKLAGGPIANATGAPATAAPESADHTSDIETMMRDNPAAFPTKEDAQSWGERYYGWGAGGGGGIEIDKGGMVAPPPAGTPAAPGAAPAGAPGFSQDIIGTSADWGSNNQQGWQRVMAAQGGKLNPQQRAYVQSQIDAGENAVNPFTSGSAGTGTGTGASGAVGAQGTINQESGAWTVPDAATYKPGTLPTLHANPWMSPTLPNDPNTVYGGTEFGQWQSPDQATQDAKNLATINRTMDQDVVDVNLLNAKSADAQSQALDQALQQQRSNAGSRGMLGGGFSTALESGTRDESTRQMLDAQRQNRIDAATKNRDYLNTAIDKGETFQTGQMNRANTSYTNQLKGQVTQSLDTQAAVNSENEAKATALDQSIKQASLDKSSWDSGIALHNQQTADALAKEGLQEKGAQSVFQNWAKSSANFLQSKGLDIDKLIGMDRNAITKELGIKGIDAERYGDTISAVVSLLGTIAGIEATDKDNSNALIRSIMQGINTGG